MKSLHELFTELETWLSHFRQHAAPPSPAPAAVTQAAPATPAEVVPGTTVPSNPLLDSYLHSGGNAHLAPPVEAAPADPDWNAGMGYKSGTFAVPAWWWTGGGFVRALGDCEIHFQGGEGQYDIVVNQGSIPQAPEVTVTSDVGVVTVSLASPSSQHVGTVQPVNGEIVVRTHAVGGGCVVNLYRHA